MAKSSLSYIKVCRNKGLTMKQDEIIEIAKKSGFNIETSGLITSNAGEYITNKLTKFAELILASQAQPTPSKSEPVAWRWKYEVNNYDWMYGTLDPSFGKYPSTSVIEPLYTNPQPTPSQSFDELVEFHAWFNIEFGESYNPSEGMILAWQARAQLSNPQPTPSQNVAERSEHQGFVLMPIEPTEAIEEAIEDLIPYAIGTESRRGIPSAKTLYNAMLNASKLSKPQPTSQDEEEIMKTTIYYVRNALEKAVECNESNDYEIAFDIDLIINVIVDEMKESK